VRVCHRLDRDYLIVVNMHLTLINILTLVSLKRTVLCVCVCTCMRGCAWVHAHMCGCVRVCVSPPDNIVVRNHLVKAWDQTFTVCHFLILCIILWCLYFLALLISLLFPLFKKHTFILVILRQRCMSIQICAFPQAIQELLIHLFLGRALF
jgi:hypothetical protein